jgi:adenosylhomocysteine nucleosidase
METIGLLAAMTQESDALLRRVTGWKRIPLGSLRACRFEHAGRVCILVTTGMGVRRAAEATRLLATEYKPRLLVSFGIAGAVEVDLEIGDVVAAEACCEPEAGAPGPLRPLGLWPPAALEAIAQALAARQARLFRGVAVTTRGAQATQGQLGGLTHPILEMETAGIARMAAEKGIPLLSLRAISDGPRAPIPFDLGDIMDDDANLQIGKLLKAVARRPGTLLQVGQLRRSTSLAAENAAIALAAALGHL